MKNSWTKNSTQAVFQMNAVNVKWFYLGKKVFDLQLNKAFKLGTFLLFFSILLSL